MRDPTVSEMLSTLGQLLEEDWTRDGGTVVGLCRGCKYYDEDGATEKWDQFCNTCPFFNSNAWVKINDLAKRIKLEEMLDE
ncbi:hypothetical protein VPMG_00022 [Vibrio phage VBP32]|uniref:Uncharacterized protein n=2 Tax=Stoningtonvirus VBP47 TaxID=2846606 RepID=M4SPA7_9CAUD|nr:hypothetical protein VPNG_00106 [Vibrio phage VBP47]YP_007676512.1 hypothetical protein VPMG_00022 [Vibrio phage VBP32]AGH57130.1 hypothetical protein VPNG_00106 [Vibrio phage VBP47]AGH57161.1 hypothetical protein VPMG_00022 [Vibrio phage VBP32]